MAYDEDLALRVRVALGPALEAVGSAAVVDERRMFGGLAFMVGGHMALAASDQGGLMVRVGPDHAAALEAEPGVAPMEMRGRPMAGWLRVSAEAVRAEESLARWVGLGVAFAGTLPAR